MKHPNNPRISSDFQNGGGEPSASAGPLCALPPRRHAAEALSIPSHVRSALTRRSVHERLAFYRRGCVRGQERGGGGAYATHATAREARRFCHRAGGWRHVGASYATPRLGGGGRRSHHHSAVHGDDPKVRTRCSCSTPARSLPFGFCSARGHSLSRTVCAGRHRRRRPDSTTTW